MFIVAAVEALYCDVGVREVGACGGAGLVGAVGTVAVVVVDLGVGDGDGGVCETGEDVFGGGGVESCVCEGGGGRGLVGWVVGGGGWKGDGYLRERHPGGLQRGLEMRSMRGEGGGCSGAL